MRDRTTVMGALLQDAALARIAELTNQRQEDRMIAADNAAGLDRQFKGAVRRMWALGDYHRFALATVWPLGSVLVEACGITRGQRVLDVAAGTGNTAIRAAEAGADVVAADLTPENFEAGRRAAAAHGVELEWIEADAEALPFPDADFDVVTSSFGAIFAPDHAAVAREMTRVCKPGGVIGMTAFTPDGVGAQFFELIARYAPPQPDNALPPLLWGTEDHVRALFRGRVDKLELRRAQYVERSEGGPDAYRELFETTFGPIIAIRAGLDDERRAAFDREFREFTMRCNHGPADAAAEYTYDYLLIVARRGDL